MAARLAAGSSRTWVYKRLAEVAEEHGGRLSIDCIESLTEAVRGEERRIPRPVPDQCPACGPAGAGAGTGRTINRIPIPSFSDYLRALPVEPPAN